MDQTRQSLHTESPRVRRRRQVVVAVLLSLLVIGGATVLTLLALTRASGAGASPVSTATAAVVTPTPTATVLTPAQRLLNGSTDPNACAVSFTGDGIAGDPILQTSGILYTGLPIPLGEGRVFAGWYDTPENAAALSVPGRINGSDIVVCTDQQVTLYGAWATPEANISEGARIPILMYHQFTTNPAGESGWLRGNYAYIGDFDAHMNHIATTGFYLPTWDELSAFIDGRLYLPNHSVIITDDDADQTWFDLAAPVVANYELLATSFMITAHRQDPAPNPYMLRRSHTHDMHQSGKNGQGRIVNWTVPEIVADMEVSAQVLGVKEVMAYPFGHHNDTAKEGLRQAGWEMARTIEPGYVTIGTDKLALPTVRINYGMDLNALINLVG